MPTLTLIRGLPGSGKTTLAKTMLGANPGLTHVESDFWMTDSKGAYRFRPERLGECHRRCQKAARRAMIAGKDVVVSNTFVRRREIKPYRLMAEQLGCDLRILHCDGQYPNLHGVSDATLERMAKAWESLDA